MKKNFILCFSLLLIFTLSVTGCKKEVEVKNGSKVAVSVKGAKITATEYYEEIKADNISKLIDKIDHELFDEKYKDDKKEDEEINKQIEQIKSNYGNDEETFKNVIKSYFGVESENELKDILRLEYKRSLAVDDYIIKNLSEKEIEKYYEENIYGDMKASHILIGINVNDNATEEEKAEDENVAKAKAEKIIKQLNEGGDFKKLAKKYSDDEKTASKGGDLGYFSYDEMLEDFSKATAKLNNNEYTKEPIKTNYGYHIILKTGQKEKPKLSKVKSDIQKTLKNEKLSKDSTLHYKTLDKIRKENNIKFNDSTLEKAYNDYMDSLIESAQNNTQATQ